MIFIETVSPALGRLAAFDDTGEYGEDDEEDDEAEPLGGVGEVFADEAQRVVTAAARKGDDDEARGKQRTATLRRAQRDIALAGLDALVDEVAHDGANHERRLHGGRQVDAHADRERRQAETPRVALQQLVDDDEQHAESEADVDVLPGEVVGENALRDGRHEGGLRRGEGLAGIHVRTRQRTGEAIGLIEQVQHRRDDEGADETAQQQRDLLAPRRSTDEVAGLEVLHVIVRDAGDGHDDGCRENGRGRGKFLAARHRKDTKGRAECIHHERGHDDAEDTDTRNRAGGRTDEAGHVGAGRGTHWTP